jgi:hypothetical protein
MGSGMIKSSLSEDGMSPFPIASNRTTADPSPIASFTESTTQNITIHQRYIPPPFTSPSQTPLLIHDFSGNSGVVLAKVVEYLAYKHQYANTPSSQVMEDFSDRIEPELALELYVLFSFCFGSSD